MGPVGLSSSVNVSCLPPSLKRSLSGFGSWARDCRSSTLLFDHVREDGLKLLLVTDIKAMTTASSGSVM